MFVFSLPPVDTPAWRVNTVGLCETVTLKLYKNHVVFPTQGLLSTLYIYFRHGSVETRIAARRSRINTKTIYPIFTCTGFTKHKTQYPFSEPNSY